MVNRKKYVLSIALVFIAFFIIFMMILFQKADAGEFFFLWFLGVLAIVEIVSPRYAESTQLQYLRYVIAAGIIVFSLIMTSKLIELLSL